MGGANVPKGGKCSLFSALSTQPSRQRVTVDQDRMMENAKGSPDQDRANEVRCSVVTSLQTARIFSQKSRLVNRIAVAGIAIIMFLQGNLLLKSHQIHNAFRSTSAVWEREQQQQSLFDNEFPLPKVVILPGPHKTGSSSVQGCMASWTWTELSRTEQLPVVLSNWSWAVPTHENMVRAGLADPSPSKGFACSLGLQT